MTTPSGLVISPAPSSKAWRPPLSYVVALWDLFIALELVVVAGVLAFGDFDLGWVSSQGVAKPILILIVVVPARLALARSSPWFDGFVGAARRVQTRVAPRLGVPLRQRIQDVTFAFLVTRLTGWTVAFFANVLLPSRGVRAFQMPFERDQLLEIFAAFDSGWYFSIAQRGYYFLPHAESSVAFFPLYPLLMRLVAWPLGGTDAALWLAGILVSVAAFVGALFTLHALTEEMTGSREIARRTILYLSVFPFSLFLTRVYAESLFLLLSLLAVRAACRSSWWQAGIWGGLAAVTRPNGILIAIPVIWLALSDAPRGWALVKRMTPLALVPVGLALFCGYAYLLAGDPFAWLDAQRHWGYSVGHAPWRSLVTLVASMELHGPYEFLFTSPMAPSYLFHGATALLFLALTPFVFKRLGFALGAYVLASLLLPLSGSDLTGIGRYASVLFPVFIVLGSVESTRLHEVILVTSALFLALFSGLFVTLYPIY